MVKEAFNFGAKRQTQGQESQGEIRRQKERKQRQKRRFWQRQRMDPIRQRKMSMARFNPVKIHFGDPAQADGDEDNGEGLPTPALIRLKARRAAGIREAKETLALLPGPGESLHALCTARMDLTDVIGHLLERFGPCRLHVATLGYNERNLRTMLSWIDQGAARELTLIASIFFRAIRPNCGRRHSRNSGSGSSMPSVALRTRSALPCISTRGRPSPSKEALTYAAMGAAASNSPSSTMPAWQTGIDRG